jgi:predicted RNase H-like HicB family nuclease
MRKLSAVIYPDDESDWLIAFNPETGTTTQGKSPAKALANLKEATRLYLEEFPLRTNQRITLMTFTISVQ